MKHLVVFVPAAALILASTAVSAQSLGDVARREQERRKTAAPAQKAYTTGDLKPAPAPAVAPPPPAAAGQPAAVPPSPSGTQPPPAAEPGKDEPKKDEKYWRDRMQTERDALQRAQTFAEALQSRVNALSTDFVARDDPAQRSVLANDRQKALAEMDRVTREIEQHTKAIADIQEEARRAGVPAGWVR